MNQPSVASTNDILNGNGTQAGLTQVIAERQQADLGANGLGRLVIPALSRIDGVDQPAGRARRSASSSRA